MPVRLATRKMWVSTAIAGSRNQVLSTTFAVLRPTPGRLSSAARDDGTSPPNRSTRIAESFITCRALLRKSPMVRMCSISRSSPSASIFAGVSATLKSASVARLTPLSVACADSATATSRVKALVCASSPLGSGSAA